MRVFLLLCALLGGCNRNLSRIVIADGLGGLSYGSDEIILRAREPLEPLTPSLGGAASAFTLNPVLPEGLSFDAQTGVISGTPLKSSAAARYTVVASNEKGSTSVSFLLSVIDDPPSELVYATANAVYVRGATIEDNVPANAGGVPTQYSVLPPLPVGLSLNAETGIISGTPLVKTALAAYEVTAQNNFGASKILLSVSVNEPLPELTFVGAPYTFLVGDPARTTTPINSGGPIVNCAFADAALPGFQVIASTCEIIGFPQAAQEPTVVTLRVTGESGERLVSVSITTLGALAIFPRSARLNIAEPAPFTFAAEQAAEPYRFSVLSGLGSITSDGVFSGVGVPGVTTIAVQDARGRIATAQVTEPSAWADGPIYAVAEHFGGLLLGGDFKAVNVDLSPGVAPVDRASLALDRTLDLGDGFDGTVRALASNGSTLFVGGDFGAYRGEVVRGFAAIDTHTGELLYRMPPGVVGSVTTIIVTQDAVYVAGSLEQQGYAGVLRLSLTDGKRDTSFVHTAPAPVQTMILAHGALYVATQSSVLKMDPVSGQADLSFAPMYSGAVRALAADASSVFIGGYGSTRVVRVDPADGSPLAFSAPSLGNVHALTLAGDSLIAGGEGFLASVDRQTGVAQTTFDGFAGSSVDALAVVDDALLVGGERFVSYRGDGVFETMLRLRLSDGELLARADGKATTTAAVHAFAADTKRVFIGSAAKTYGGTLAGNLASIDASTRAVNSLTSAQGVSGTVHVIKITVNDDIFVAGEISAYRGTPVNNVVKISPVGDHVPAFSAPLGTPKARVLHEQDGGLFVGGLVPPVEPSGGLVKLNRFTGVAVGAFASTGVGCAVTPPVFAPCGVYAMRNYGNAVIVGGSFDRYNSTATAQAPVLRINESTGATEAYMTAGTLNGAVMTIASSQPGGYVLVGGFFTVPSQGLVQMYESSGGLSNQFETYGSPNGHVRSVAWLVDRAFVAGGFTLYRQGTPREASAGGLLMLDLSDAVTIPLHPSFKTPISIEGRDDLRVTSVSAGLFLSGTLRRYRDIPVSGAIVLDKLLAEPR